MLLIIKLILVLLALSAVVVLTASFWRRFYAFDPGYSQTHFVPNGDGWNIALFRYLPETKLHETPIILCHGVAANRFTFDLGDEQSLARYLKAHGYEVWSVDMRGRGHSQPTGKKWNNKNKLYVIDDFIQRDAPAAISYIQKESGSSQVFWVGHSMGGIILYGLLQGERAKDIAAGIAIAAPGNFKHMSKLPLPTPLRQLIGVMPALHWRMLAATFAPVAPWMPASLRSVVCNPKNVEPIRVRRALCHLVSNISRGEMLQFFDCAKNRELRSFDGTYSYHHGFKDVTTPLLLMAGSHDFLCVPDCVVDVYHAIASEQKELIVLGKSYGQRENYGHGDIVIGKHCQDEVFPHILRWLDKRGANP